MKAIFKYDLAISGYQSVQIYKNAQILCVQLQKGFPKIWAMVDTEEALERRHCEVFETGQEMPEISLSDERVYIGTCQLSGGLYVFHVFEIKSKS